MSYAEGTGVSVEKSQAEINALLAKHGASQRGTYTDDEAGLAVVGFTMSARQVRLQIPLPPLSSIPKERPKGARASWSREKVYEQACRERWRGVALLVKAKLEAIAIGVSSVEREFLADIALPNGKTVHQQVRGELLNALQGAKIPALLLGPATGVRS